MEQQVSKSLQAKMLRKFIQVAPLLYCVQKIATTVQENAGDILAEAKQINADRAAAEAYVEDEEVTEAAEAQAEEAQAE